MRVSSRPAPACDHVDSASDEDAYKRVLTELNRLICGDDNDALEHLMSNHPTFDLRKTLNEQSPPLHLAVNRSTEAVIATLLNHARGHREVLSSTEFAEDSVLTVACILRKTPVIKMILDAGADVNEADVRTGVTPLMWAASVGNIEAMSMLCDAGADMNVADNEGRTALWYAISLEHAEGVDTLLQKGAKMDQPHYRSSSLSFAITRSNVPVLKALLKHGADVSARTQVWGITPLMQAAGRINSSGMVNVLLGAGADIVARDYRGYTALMSAAEANDVDMIQTLAAYPGLEVDATSYHQLAAFDVADSVNYRRAARELTASSPSRGIFLHSETALMIAAHKGCFAAVEALLDMGARVNARNDQGYTVLMLAAESGAHELVTVLCDRGANPNLSTGEGLTALAIGVNSYIVKLVEALIDKGANVNQKINNKNETVLMLAVRNKDGVLISALHGAGANLDAQDSVGYTALGMAINGGEFSLVKKLLALGANPNAGDAARIIPLSIAAGLGDVRIVMALLESRADVNASDARGFTALMAAAQGNHVGVVKCLLNAGANIRATTATGLTAKYYATRADSQDAIELLTAFGDGGSSSKRRIGMG